MTKIFACKTPSKILDVIKYTEKLSWKIRKDHSEKCDFPFPIQVVFFSKDNKPFGAVHLWVDLLDRKAREVQKLTNGKQKPTVNDVLSWGCEVMILDQELHNHEIPLAEIMGYSEG